MKRQILSIAVLALCGNAFAQTAGEIDYSQQPHPLVVFGVPNSQTFQNIPVSEYQNDNTNINQVTSKNILIGVGAGTNHLLPNADPMNPAGGADMNNISIGNGSSSSLNGTAIGPNAQAVSNLTPASSMTDKFNKQGSTAVGYNSMAVDGGTALGMGAKAFVGSVSIGSNTINNELNTVAFGNRRLTQVLAGTNPLDAVNYSQLSSQRTELISLSQNYAIAAGNNALQLANAYTNSVICHTGCSNTNVTEANAYTDIKTSTIKQEAVTEANTYTDSVGASVLNSANTYTDNSIKGVTNGFASKDYVNGAVQAGVAQSNAYTDQRFNEASKIAYSAASVGMASSALVFNPNLPRQVAIGAASVHGTSALAVGMAWKHGDNGMINVRGALGQNGTSGFAVGYSMAW